MKIPEWIIIEKDYPQKALECADLAVVASGTSTVEAAVFGTPMVIIYKMSSISWWISKILVKIPYIGMVNIIAGYMIMPEILQKNVNSNKIFNTIIEIINNPKKIAQMKSDLLKIQNQLKGNYKTKTASDYIFELNVDK